MKQRKETTEEKVKSRLDGQTFRKSVRERYNDVPFPWMVFSTRELAAMLQVPLQTVHNWNLRGTGPVREEKGRWRGNRRYYTLANIVAWLDDRPAWHIYRDWAVRTFGDDYVEASKAKTEDCVNEIIKLKAFRQPNWKLKRLYTLPLVNLNEVSSRKAV